MYLPRGLGAWRFSAGLTMHQRSGGPKRRSAIGSITGHPEARKPPPSVQVVRHGPRLLLLWIASLDSVNGR